MRQPVGFGQPGCTSVMPRSESVREAMAADLPGMFALWGSRAHAVIDSQIRRRKNRKAEEEREEQQRRQQEQGTPNTTAGDTNGNAGTQPPTTKPAQKNKREWWRLDPNTSDKYKPVEPPAVPDPNIVPTIDRIVFGWEAPLSPLELVVQDDVRRFFPKLHEWIVRRAIERADLLPPTQQQQPPAGIRIDPHRTAAPPEPGVHDIDLEPGEMPPHEPQ